MNNFTVLNEKEIKEVNGGALEILLWTGTVLSGPAAWAVVGGGVLVLGGVAAAGFYVASQQ